MLDVNDFVMKQIIVFQPARGDKLAFKNQNIIIKDKDGKVKYQHTCYRIFMILIVGDCSITSGLMRLSKKFGFSICFMTYSYRFYTIIGNGLEGNNYLHKKQYMYSGTELGRVIIINKIINQRETLKKIRNKNEYILEGIKILDTYIDFLVNSQNVELKTLLGYEGNAAKVYFSRVFDNVAWNSRKPRIKYDFVNSTLDIGYTILFSFIECILRVYDFDVFQGVLHTNFYMRKSLVCDLMEPFRPIIDYKIRKGINLGQFKKEDFIYVNNQWNLQYKLSSIYAGEFMEELLENKEYVFLYIRNFYRAFMKEKNVEQFPIYKIGDKRLTTLELMERQKYDNNKL